MKIKLTILLSVILLSGCTEQNEIPRSEVIKACQECTAAGMETEIIRNGFTHIIFRVNCIPKNHKVETVK